MTLELRDDIRQLRDDILRIIEAGKWEIQKHEDILATERVLAWLDAQEQDLKQVVDEPVEYDELEAWAW